MGISTKSEYGTSGINNCLWDKISLLVQSLIRHSLKTTIVVCIVLFRGGEPMVFFFFPEKSGQAQASLEQDIIRS